MEKSWFSVADVAEKTGIPQSTIRRYLSLHSKTLNVRQRGGRGGYEIAGDSVEVLKQIRDCYDQKMTTEQVEDLLLQSGAPITVTLEEDGKESITLTPAQAFIQMKDVMMAMANQIQELNQEVAATQEKLDSAHREIANFKKQQSEEASSTRKEISSLKHEQSQALTAITDELKFVQDGLSRLDRERQKKDEKSWFKRLFD